MCYRHYRTATAEQSRTSAAHLGEKAGLELRIACLVKANDLAIQNGILDVALQRRSKIQRRAGLKLIPVAGDQPAMAIFEVCQGAKLNTHNSKPGWRKLQVLVSGKDVEVRARAGFLLTTIGPALFQQIGFHDSPIHVPITSAS
jgi:hypothetical protein